MGIYLPSGLSFVIKRKNTSKNTESAKNRSSEDDENNSDYEESYFSYDVANNLSVFTDSEGRDTTFLYDDFGNLLQQTSPDSGTTSYEYDEAGNLTSRTDAQQKTTGYTYDTENRISVIDYPGTYDDVTFTYDQGTYGKGRLTGVNSAKVSYSYTYNSLGHLVSEQKDIDDLTNYQQYSYDSSGRLLSIT
ncbi:MAG: hypothetical protein PVG39_31770, partial [Desulfobacteraceae bacterium]